MIHNPISPQQVHYGHFVSRDGKNRTYWPLKIKISITPLTWSQRFSFTLWWTANNMSSSTRVRKQFEAGSGDAGVLSSFFCGSTSRLDDRFVSDALLTAPSLASLQWTWWSSLIRWSSVTLKSRPTGFITTFIIVALVRSGSHLSHLWHGRAQPGFYELGPG